MAKKKSSAACDDGSESLAAIDFETALAEVEQIVSLLEGGDLGLTESLHHYERGIKRLKQCHELLGLAEQRVTLLSGFDADGNPVTESLRAMEVRSGTGREKKSRTQRRTPNSATNADEGANDPVAGDRMDDFPELF